MIYQRLRVAKNLLASNGVVMISIDDAETANVLNVCNEIFGEGILRYFDLEKCHGQQPD